MTEEQVAAYFARDKERIDEHERRLDEVERKQEDINKLTLSVTKLATNMEYMVAEQKEQGKRLQRLEAEPADNAKYLRRTIISCVLTAVASAVVGALLGLLL